MSRWLMKSGLGSPRLLAGAATAVCLLGAAPGALAASVDACPNSSLRSTLAASLPDCRAFEMVSPIDKNGFDVGNIPQSAVEAGGPATSGGDAIAFQSAGAFAASVWGGSGTLSFLSRRSADGWRTTGLTPAPIEARGVNASGVNGFTPGMDRSLVFSAVALAAGPSDSNNWYLRDNDTGGLTLLQTSPTTRNTIVSSRDLSRFALDTFANLTADPDAPDNSVVKVYENVGGSTRLVSRQPGTDAPFQTAANLGAAVTSTNVSSEGAMSEDGRHIFFSALSGDGVDEIYRRSDGASTVLASPSKRTPADSPRPKRYWLATPDGERVFFTTTQRLTDDANDPAGAFDGDLYRYDLATDDLVDLSAGTAGGAAAEVAGVVGTDRSGDRVYYVATGQVVPGEGASDGRPNLYLWEDDGTAQGATRFIATLSTADVTNWRWDSARTSRVTADGRHAMIETAENVAGYDAQGNDQVYVYDADADSGQGALTCVSCNSGAAPVGPVKTPIKPDGVDIGARPRAMSEDGTRVVFSSPDPLVDHDGNGRYDAYLWDSGEVYLLSGGTSSYDSFAFGMSDDGDDVFFRTRESLVPVDKDTLVDLYTAHVGGGFAGQHAVRDPGCDDDVCQGLPTSPPSAANTPTDTQVSRGNVRPARDCGRFTRRANRLAAQRKQLLKRARRAPTQQGERKLRRKATRVSKQLKRQRASARRCVRQAGGSGK